MPSRRVFLQVLCASAASRALLGCSSEPAFAPTNVGGVAAGKASDLTVGALHALGNQPVCIGRDDKGIYAMTLTCTHQGCNIAVEGTVNAQGIACNCHGSRFDVHGGVVNGPAASPLQHFEVDADAAGNLTVATDKTVDPSTRLMM